MLSTKKENLIVVIIVEYSFNSFIIMARYVELFFLFQSNVDDAGLASIQAAGKKIESLVMEGEVNVIFLLLESL